jgi:glycosyltransferase involved in cell wall biosynthesis
MTFFFDCRFIRVDHHDGISRFSSELFASVSKQTEVTALICEMEQIEKLPPATKYLKINDPKNPIGELFLPRVLNKAGASVVFSPMQTMGSIGKRYKLILTLHDLIYYKHRKPPGFLAWPIRLVWRLFHLSYMPVRFLLNRADAVVTISETTKLMMEKHSLTKNSIHVVHNASSMVRVQASKPEPINRNLVYMGSFMPYKNVELLIKALGDLPEYSLTLCSRISDKRKQELIQSLPQATISRLRFLDGTSEADYQKLLDDSFALVTASRDEGFGIPVIEAMTRATPVIVSDIQIFREVASDGGSFFDPDDVSAFTNAVRTLETIENWQQASKASLDRSAFFKWDQSANELLKVVNQLRA